MSLYRRWAAKVRVPADVEACWEWTASKNDHGYGRMTAGRGVNLKAHRVAYELHNGPVPDDKCVLHECDNPPCCNPLHLFLGTKKDNTHDMMAKGRMSPPPIHTGDDHPLRRYPHLVRRGQSNGNSRTNRAKRAAEAANGQ
jgi:hypothetical protein